MEEDTESIVCMYGVPMRVHHEQATDHDHLDPLHHGIRLLVLLVQRLHCEYPVRAQPTLAAIPSRKLEI